MSQSGLTPEQRELWLASADRNAAVTELCALLEHNFDAFTEALTGQPYAVLMVLRHTLAGDLPQGCALSPQQRTLGAGMVKRHITINGPDLVADLITELGQMRSSAP